MSIECKILKKRKHEIKNIMILIFKNLHGWDIHHKLETREIIGYNNKGNPTKKHNGRHDPSRSELDMSYSLENISESLESRIQRSGGGYIKLGFEGGRLVAANLHSNPTEEERKFPKVTQNFDLRKEIGEALKSNFYGTLGFIFSENKITNYYKSQTWKGPTLDLFIRG